MYSDYRGQMSRQETQRQMYDFDAEPSRYRYPVDYVLIVIQPYDYVALR